MTCHEGLTTLPGHGQLVNLCQHTLEQIGKRPPEKPRRRCRPVRGPTIDIVQHRPHLVAAQGQAAMVVLHLREIAVATFHCRRGPRERPGMLTPPTLASPPAPRLSVSGCTDAAQTPLPPPGARVRSGPFAPDNACGAVALASTSGATITRQPTGSTSGSWPSAPSLGGPSAGMYLKRGQP